MKRLLSINCKEGILRDLRTTFEVQNDSSASSTDGIEDIRIAPSSEAIWAKRIKKNPLSQTIRPLQFQCYPKFEHCCRSWKIGKHYFYRNDSNIRVRKFSHKILKFKFKLFRKIRPLTSTMSLILSISSSWAAAASSSRRSRVAICSSRWATVWLRLWKQKANRPQISAFPDQQ